MGAEKSDPTIFILLPVYNRKAITLKFIASLKNQTHQNFQLILIDDGSTDGTSEAVSAELPSTTVLRGAGDLWWGGALELGRQHLADLVKSGAISEKSPVLIINDDTVFDADYLEKGVRYLAQREKQIVGSRCRSQETGELNDVGTVAEWGRFEFRQARDSNEVDCLSTRGIFFRLGDFRIIGGFFPTLLPHYASDYEFTLRAHRKGFLLFVPADLEVRVEDRSTGIHQIKDKDPKWVLRNYFSKRNVLNPIYLTTFVLLACPWKWKARNLAYIWARAAFHLGRAGFQLIRASFSTF